MAILAIPEVSASPLLYFIHNNRRVAHSDHLLLPLVAPTGPGIPALFLAAITRL